MLRALTRALALATVVAAPLALPAASATAAASPGGETYARPAGTDPVFHLAGHGWGHGHGMSQNGAHGAALRGLTAEKITEFYYPGTALADLPDSPLRVRVGCSARRDTCASAVVSAAQGLVLTDGGAPGRPSTPLPAAYGRYRISVDTAGYHVEGEDPEGRWNAYPAAGVAYAGPLELSAAGGTGPPVVRLWYEDNAYTRWREYRGTLRAVATDDRSALRVVDVVGMEDYLLGTVPRESPSSWPAQALGAQAIAARTYAAYERDHAPSSRAWDMCDTTSCQVYGGYALGRSNGSGGVDAVPLETASAAVAATRGEIRTYDGSAIFSQFSASDGGWTSAGSQPYLVAKADPYDGIPQARAEQRAGHPLSDSHSWTAALPVSALERAYPRLGTLTALRITARDGHGEWGGRVRAVVLDGVDKAGQPTSVALSGNTLLNLWMWPAHAGGLRHSWFTVTDPPGRAEVTPTAPTLRGPARAARGGRVVLSGSAPRARAVELAFREGDGPWQHVSLRPGRRGAYRAAVPATADVTAYAAVGTSRSRTVRVAVRGTTISGPRRVRRGATVTVRGLALPGSTVTVCWRQGRAGGCAASSRSAVGPDARWSARRSVRVTQRVSATAAGARSRVLLVRVG